jgi:hypothetical protein
MTKPFVVNRFARVALAILAPLLSLVVLWRVWYYVVMGDDNTHLANWSHALSSAPDYPPTIVMILTITSFVGLWLALLTTYWIVRRIRRKPAMAQ